MKRMISFVLALGLALALLCGAAAEETGKEWPVRGLTGQIIFLKPASYLLKDIRRQTFAGPGRRYALSGAFRPDRVVTATALCREGDYVLTNLDYANSKRVVYFETQSLVSTDGVPEEKLEGVKAKTTKTVWPVYYGPGKEYDIVTQRTRSRFADLKPEILEELFEGDETLIERALKDAIHWVGVDAGSSVEVFFETNGWVYVETNCSIGPARFWLPASALE